jgi:hypothetical protein
MLKKSLLLHFIIGLILTLTRPLEHTSQFQNPLYNRRCKL